MNSNLRKSFIICAGFALIWTLSGCASLPFLKKNGTAADAKVKAENKAEQRAGESLLKAFIDNHPDDFLKILPQQVQEEFGVNGFKKSRETMVSKLGTPFEYSFVLNLEHPRFTVSIWKIRFKRKSSDNKKTIYQEILFRAVSGKINGKETLLSFNFF